MQRVADWALVVGLHDGARGRHVAQPDGVAKLVDSHRKQVHIVGIWEPQGAVDQGRDCRTGHKDGASSCTGAGARVGRGCDVRGTDPVPAEALLGSTRASRA